MPSSDYFIASDAELDAACRGWRAPLEAPTMITVKNPFTGEPVPAKNYDPNPGAPFPANVGRHVEFNALPHADLNPVDVLSLALLMQAALGVSDRDSDLCYAPARVAPPSSEEAVFAVPAELTTALAAMSDIEADPVVDRWIMLHDDLGVSPGIPSDRAASGGILDQLRTLARQAQDSGRKMFLVMGP